MPKLVKVKGLLIYKNEIYKEKQAEYEDWRCDNCAFWNNIECTIESDSIKYIGTLCPSHIKHGYYIKGIPKKGI